MKFIPRKNIKTTFAVAPRTGAWIEIRVALCPLRAFDAVAPRTGGVD